MTRKEKHDPHCKKNPDGTVTFCPHCEFHNPETLAVRSTTTPQQPEEPIGANLDQTGEEFIERISKLPAQQQPKDKCKNYLPICFNCGRSQSAHPQQTEQWMEEWDRMVNPRIPNPWENNTAWLVEHTKDHLFSDEEYPESQYELDEDKVKSFIKSQIEAAEKRGKDKGRSEERLDLVAAIAIAAHEYLKDLVETDEEGIAEIVGKAVASLTSHN